MIRGHLGSILLVSRAEVMIDRDSWGHSFLTVGGETLGFVKDGRTLAKSFAKDVFIDRERKLGDRSKPVVVN